MGPTPAAGAVGSLVDGAAAVVVVVGLGMAGSVLVGAVVESPFFLRKKDLSLSIASRAGCGLNDQLRVKLVIACRRGRRPQS